MLHDRYLIVISNHKRGCAVPLWLRILFFHDANEGYCLCRILAWASLFFRFNHIVEYVK